MSNKYQREAQRLLSAAGGVGAPVSITAQQVGAPQVYPQQVGMPNASVVPAGAVGAQVQYAPEGYKSGGLTYCGFPRVSIAAGATNISVPVNVRRPFLPQLWQMPSTAFGLQIHDFDVEGVGLFANPITSSVPQVLVSEVSQMPQIQWVTLDPSTNGSFIVSNPTGAVIVFEGAFWGTNLLRA